LKAPDLAGPGYGRGIS